MDKQKENRFNELVLKETLSDKEEIEFIELDNELEQELCPEFAIDTKFKNFVELHDLFQSINKLLEDLEKQNEQSGLG